MLTNLHNFPQSETFLRPKLHQPPPKQKVLIFFIHTVQLKAYGKKMLRPTSPAAYFCGEKTLDFHYGVVSTTNKKTVSLSPLTDWW